jgi:hypothetical protein
MLCEIADGFPELPIYLDALRRYSSDSTAEIIGVMQAHA